MPRHALFPSVPLPDASRSRLTHARLRRPTPLPVSATRAYAASYMQRVFRLFGGE